MNIPPWLYMLPVAAVNVCASLLLKAGASDRTTAFLLNLISWRSFAGLCCFGIGGLAYAWLLKYVPLGVAQAVLSSQYIFTILGAWLILHENMTSLQVVGFIFVGIGIALVVMR